MAADRDDSIAGLLEDVEHAAKTPARQRAAQISGKIDRLCLKAYDEGLSSASLNKLVDLLTLPNELDQASINSLIRNLYPATKVPSTIVIKVVGSLGHGRAKPSYNAQAAMLKWLIMVYDVLENQKILSQLYGIIFNLLDTIAIRAQLCHVLSLITRRKHVRPYRIQQLMELTRRSGNEPPLVGLMRVFKDYYPDVIVGDVTSGRASVFTHPNQEWRERLGEIQAVHFQKTQDGLAPEQRTFRVTRRGMNGTKQSKSLVVPEVHTSHAQESSVTLEEIEDVHDFVQKLEKIEPPNQLVAVIGDPLLQKFLQLKSSDIYRRRADNWLYAFFEDQLQSKEPSETKILEILQTILQYTQYTKVLPSACFAYLKDMIPSWNGVFGRQAILDLLSYAPIEPWKDLYPSTFQPLEDAILEDETTESKLILLTFYRNLVDHWVISFLTHPSPSELDPSSITFLVEHCNILASTIVQSSQSVNTLSTILTFYESYSSLLSHPTLQDVIHITIPPAQLIYTLHFTPSLNILSRLCSVLSLYKRAFEKAITPSTADPTIPRKYVSEYLNGFNGYLMDVCNCIWRLRAFNSSDTNAVGCRTPKPTISSLDAYVKSLSTSLSLQSLFSLSFSPVLCLLAIEYVRELEDKAAEKEEIEVRHPGPVTLLSLKQLERDGGLKLGWQEYRLGILHRLEEKGVNGLGELMYNTMKGLMSARETRAR